MATTRNWTEIQQFYDEGKSQRDLVKHFKLSFKQIQLATKRGDFKPRSKSDAVKLVNEIRPKVRSEATKAKTSESMKKAHEEGRAWNIGMSRWNNQPSWPEQWFMKVIENEGLDPNYTREMPFGKYSLDFAWSGLKKCIEIDGEQHERCEKQKARDVAKDSLLTQQGWQVLRLRWKDIYSDSKGSIQKAKAFLAGPLGEGV